VKIPLTVLIILFISISAICQQSDAPFELKFTIGSSEPKDSISLYRLVNDGGELLVFGRKSIDRWDLTTGKLIASKPISIPDLANWDTVASFDPGENFALIADSFSWRLIRKEKKVAANIIDLRTGETVKTLERPDESIRYGKWSANGDVLMTFSGKYNDKRTEICFWNGRTFELRACTVLKGTLYLNKLTGDGKRFIYSRSLTMTCLFCALLEEKGTGMIDTSNGRIVRDFTLDGRTVLIYSVVTLQDEDSNYIFRDNEKGIAVWDTNIGGDPIRTIRAADRKKDISFLTFDQEQQSVLAKNGKLLESYDVETGRLNFSVPLGLGRGNTAPFVHTMKALIIADNCDKANIFDSKTGALLYGLKLVCKTEFDPVSTSYRDFDVLRFNQTGQYLLTSSDKTVRVWDGRTGALLQALATPEQAEKKKKDPNKDDGLTHAFWAENGNSIVAAGADGRTFYVWKMSEK
jgi:WD40 repeat protein